jgi:enediyne biosynthesis thioesterase
MTLERIAANRIVMSFDYLRDQAAGQDLLARGRQTVACMRRRGEELEPVAVPEELRQALARYAA